MESISAFEIIKVGIGPSSSHTMGPWNAAAMFLELIKEHHALSEVVDVKVYLYGSLALTGVGHGTDIAVMMGLAGEDFTLIDTTTIPEKIGKSKKEGVLKLGGQHTIPFPYESAIIFEKSIFLPFHANGMTFEASLPDGSKITETYYSIGGGFVTLENQRVAENADRIVTPYPCHSAGTIATCCNNMGLSVYELVLLNEQAWRTLSEIRHQALYIWQEIRNCIYRGTHSQGILPGGLGVKRRAGDLNRKLLGEAVYSDLESWLELIRSTDKNFKNINKWVSCFALAVNEENASFGRVITAPTNGASGVIPAVLMYGYCFEDFDEDQIVKFILVAGEIGTLFKKNATISAAVGGCQAEIGVSSAMAAAALTECLGGSPGQVLMAAEIAMEHHLGLTCDPIAGLVQIPCIERNSMGAIKAITASNIALESDPSAARVSLDDVIKSMWATAQDMHHKYKETSEGGLAVNVPVNVIEC